MADKYINGAHVSDTLGSKVEANITAGDIEIGAVELKDPTTDDRVTTTISGLKRGLDVNIAGGGGGIGIDPVGLKNIALATINPATEDGNLASIKTKTDNIPTDPAKESGKLTTIDSTLTSISSTGGIKKITDTVTITGTVTANSGTNLNTSALALESGGNLASIKAKTDNIPTDPAKESGKLTTIDSTLTSISSTGGIKKITDTVTITGTVTANAGTNLNTSTLALESGGNLVSIKTNTDPKSLTITSSDATPITTATDTTIIAAQGAGKHIRVYYIEDMNSSLTSVITSWKAGAGGTKKYHASLAQNGIFAHNIDKGKSQYWDIGDNVALVLNTDAAGSIHYTVEYEVV